MTHASPQDFEFVQQIVQRAKSSFAMGMKALPREKRGYLFAIYAYCRVLDDIADEAGSPSDKQEKLQSWRDKVDNMIAGKPCCEITRVLCDGLEKFDLPTQEFYKLIDGMERDAQGSVCGLSWDQLYEYCRCVAVSVGLLSLPIFGRNDQGASEFASELGYALQLTNILRDVAEDAEINRCYLPTESLEQHGVRDIHAPNLHLVLHDVSLRARHHYENAERLIANHGTRDLKPALMMMAVYRKLYDKMAARGWQTITPRMRLSTLEKAACLAKTMVPS